MDVIITQSRAMQDDLVTRYKIPLSKTVMIRNPVDTDALLMRLQGTGTAFLKRLKVCET